MFVLGLSTVDGRLIMHERPCMIVGRPLKNMKNKHLIGVVDFEITPMTTE